MLKPDEVPGLVYLENLTTYKNEGPQADLLAKYFYLVENLFTYFLQCLAISRGLQLQGSKKEEFPGEMVVLEHVLKDQINKDLSFSCYAYKHTCEVYNHLVLKLPDYLDEERQIFIASIILAYLNNEPEEEIEPIFEALKQYDEDNEMTMSQNPLRLKGILFIKKLSNDPEKPDGVWFGLVRRESAIMGSTLCRTIPLGKNGLIFRTDFTNEMDQFYFWLWEDCEKVDGGLQFHFGPSADFYSPDNKKFCQTVEGISVDGQRSYPEWEATFYGIIY